MIPIGGHGGRWRGSIAEEATHAIHSEGGGCAMMSCHNGELQQRLGYDVRTRNERGMRYHRATECPARVVTSEDGMIDVLQLQFTAMFGNHTSTNNL